MLGSAPFSRHVLTLCPPAPCCRINTHTASVNDAPDVLDANYTTLEDTALVVNATNGVLAGSNDVDGDTITITNHTAPAHGSLSIAADGSFVYAPAANFHGSDGFSYTASDGQGGSATGHVDIDTGARALGLGT